MMDLRNAENIKESAAISARATASSEASNATTTTTTVGQATNDDGLTLSSSSVAVDTLNEEGAVYANRALHNYESMHLATESQQYLKLALHNNNKKATLCGPRLLHYVLVVFDVEQSAGPTAQPHIRIAPLKERRLKMLVFGAMEALCAGDGKPPRARCRVTCARCRTVCDALAICTPLCFR